MKTLLNFFRSHVLLVVLGYFALNFIVSDETSRIDLTEAKRHSVSSASKEKLAALPSSVTIRYYVSKSDNSMPYELRAYADKVNFYLKEFEHLSQGKLKVVRYDPIAGSEAEKNAKFDKITASINKEQNAFYFGISVSSLTQKTSIPFLHPERKSLLEYDLLQAIDTAATIEHKTIGLVSTLPIMGGNYNNERGQGKFNEWLFVTELKKRFKVEVFNYELSNLTTIKPDVLVFIHPRNFPENSVKVIDQYLAEGGKAIVMVDPFSVAVGMIDPSQTKTFKSSEFNLLFDAWGVGYNPNDVVGDMVHKSEIDRGLGAEISHTMINVLQRYINPTDPITQGIKTIGFANAGHVFPTKQINHVKLIPLISSSENVTSVKADDLVDLDRDKNAALLQEFQSDGRRRVMVAKLVGQLPRAFPDEETPLAKPSEPSEVVIFTDSDFIFDPFAGESVALSTSERNMNPRNGNFALFFNAVDHLLGDTTMPAIRSKSASIYRLEGFNTDKAQITDSFQQQFAAAKQALAEIESKLGVLSKTEQSSDIDQVVRHKAEFKALLATRDASILKLQALEVSLEQSIQDKKSYWQWLNIALMPVLIILLGIFSVALRSYKTRAL